MFVVVDVVDGLGIVNEVKVVGFVVVILNVVGCLNLVYVVGWKVGAGLGCEIIENGKGIIGSCLGVGISWGDYKLIYD